MSTPPKIRVWDLPTRLFHWLLVACVAGTFITVKVGGLWMDYHMLFGYSVLALVLFRIVWGFVGPHNARFTSFVRGPAAIRAYLKGTSARVTGHNPVGALSAILMLLLLGYQAVTGLFANDDVMVEGPLASLVAKGLSDTLTGLHKLDEVPIMIIVGIHILAILWYRVAKKQHLTRPMITGDADTAEFGGLATPTRDTWAVRLLGLAIALASAGVVFWITTLRPAGF